MSDKKLTANSARESSKEAAVENTDPERTLLTLDQLSQTIDVMSSVVNRLRAHLNEQLTSAQNSLSESTAHTASSSSKGEKLDTQTGVQKPSLIVEISSEPPSSFDTLDCAQTIH